MGTSPRTLPPLRNRARRTVPQHCALHRAGWAELRKQQPQANQEAALAEAAKQKQEQFHALQDAAFAAGASNQAEAGMSLEQQMEQDLLTDDTGDEAETAKANAKPGDIDVVKKIKKSEKKAKRAKR